LAPGWRWSNQPAAVSWAAVDTMQEAHAAAQTAVETGWPAVCRTLESWPAQARTLVAAGADGALLAERLWNCAHQGGDLLIVGAQAAYIPVLPLCECAGTSKRLTRARRHRGPLPARHTKSCSACEECVTPCLAGPAGVCAKHAVDPFPQQRCACCARPACFSAADGAVVCGRHAQPDSQVLPLCSICAEARPATFGFPRSRPVCCGLCQNKGMIRLGCADPGGECTRLACFSDGALPVSRCKEHAPSGWRAPHGVCRAAGCLGPPRFGLVSGHLRCGEHRTGEPGELDFWNARFGKAPCLPATEGPAPAWALAATPILPVLPPYVAVSDQAGVVKQVVDERTHWPVYTRSGCCVVPYCALPAANRDRSRTVLLCGRHLAPQTEWVPSPRLDFQSPSTTVLAQ